MLVMISNIVVAVDIRIVQFFEVKKNLYIYQEKLKIGNKNHFQLEI